MKDFGSKYHGEPREFAIEGQTYRIAAVLPAGALRDLTRLARLADTIDANNPNTADTTSLVVGLGDFMDEVMFPESAVRFAKAIRDPERPIGMEQINDVLRWMVEEYSARPTQPLSPSPTGQSGTGTVSTAGPQPTESIPWTLPPTAT